MSRTRKVIVSIISICLLATGLMVTPASLSATTTGLPPGLLIGDDSGIHVDSTGYYYIYVQGLQPGDVINKKITIQNAGGRAEPENMSPFALTLKAEPLEETGPVDLLDAIHLEIKLDGQVLYNGRCRGDEDVNMIDNPLNLGVYPVGTIRVLEVTFTVDPEMEVSEEISTAEFRWQFIATRRLRDIPPKTGDTLWYLLPTFGLLVSGIVLIAVKKRRSRKESD